MSQTRVGQLIEDQDVVGLIKELTSAPLHGNVISKALADIGDERAVEPIIDFMESGFAQNHKEHQKAAAEALGEMGDTRAVEALLKTFNSRHEVVRCASAEALGKIRAESALEPIIQGLRQSMDIAASSAKALGDIGDKRAVEPLIEALQGVHHGQRNDIRLREQAAIALGKLRDPKAFDHLVAAVKNSDPTCAYAAADALVEYGDLSITTFMKLMGNDAYNVRAAAAKSLGKLREGKAVDPLLNMLDDKAWWAAVEALGHLGDRKAVEPIIALLEEEETPSNIHKIAEALGNLGDPRAIDPLIKTFQNSENLRKQHHYRKSVLDVITNFGKEAMDKIVMEFIRECKTDQRLSQMDIPNFIRQVQNRDRNNLNDQYTPEIIGAGFEELLLFDEAISWYETSGLLELAAQARKKQADMSAAKIAQKIIQGDEVTSIQDSVVSRSTIGGDSGNDLMANLRELGEMKREGLLTDEEFSAAKEKLLQK